jgi:uncharacterized protein (TIGR00251 family)
MVDELFDIEPAAEGDQAEASIVLRVHAQPGAGRTAVSGRYGDALKVRVAAPPEGGRANAAATAFLAALLGVKEGDVELVSGASSRSKRFRVRGVEVDDVRRILTSALEEKGGGAGPPPRHGGR